MAHWNGALSVSLRSASGSACRRAHCFVLAAGRACHSSDIARPSRSFLSGRGPFLCTRRDWKRRARGGSFEADYCPLLRRLLTGDPTTEKVGVVKATFTTRL